MSEHCYVPPEIPSPEERLAQYRRDLRWRQEAWDRAMPWILLAIFCAAGFAVSIVTTGAPQ